MQPQGADQSPSSYPEVLRAVPACQAGAEDEGSDCGIGAAAASPAEGHGLHFWASRMRGIVRGDAWRGMGGVGGAETFMAHDEHAEHTLEPEPCSGQMPSAMLHSHSPHYTLSHAISQDADTARSKVCCCFPH